MKMSLDYLEEALELFKKNGCAVEKTSINFGKDTDSEYAKGYAYSLIKENSLNIKWEYVQSFPSLKEKYYIEIRNYHQLTMSSFPVDSWKTYPDKIEIKFECDIDTGRGISFVLHM